MSAHALGLMLHDAADYERRWLAECRAHGETQRQLDAALEILAAPYAHREDA
jgi:hypothetical protein